MTSEKMTVHKALAELKLLDDRIEKAIKENIYCVAKKHADEKINGVSLADFEKQIEQMQAEFELQKKASDALIIDLNKSLAQLEEQNQSIVKEQQEVREANDALTAENQSIVQEHQDQPHQM